MSFIIFILISTLFQTEEIGDVIWKPISEATPGSRYLQIGSSLSMEESEDYVSRMAFWDTVTADF